MTRIYVCRKSIEAGEKRVFVVEEPSGHIHRTSGIKILGPSRMIFNPGAGHEFSAWLETEAKVVIEEKVDSRTKVS